MLHNGDGDCYTTFFRSSRMRLVGEDKGYGLVRLLDSVHLPALLTSCCHDHILLVITNIFLLIKWQVLSIFWLCYNIKEMIAMLINWYRTSSAHALLFAYCFKHFFLYRSSPWSTSLPSSPPTALMSIVHLSKLLFQLPKLNNSSNWQKAIKIDIMWLKGIIHYVKTPKFRD